MIIQVRRIHLRLTIAALQTIGCGSAILIYFKILRKTKKTRKDYENQLRNANFNERFQDSTILTDNEMIPYSTKKNYCTVNVTLHNTTFESSRVLKQYPLNKLSGRRR